MSGERTSVADEYTRRATLARDAIGVTDAAEERLANARLTTFLAGGLLLLGVWQVEAIHGAWLLVPVAAFVALVVWHARLTRRRLSAERRLAIHLRGLARLDGTWAGCGSEDGTDGARFVLPEHPYSDHLDVFGRGSLFELINAARTPQGEAELASWLRAGASPDEIRARHAAISELRPRLDLREDLALLGADAAAARGLAGLPGWGEATSSLPTGAARVALHLLPVPTVLLTVAWMIADISLVPAFLALAVGLVVRRRLTAPMEEVITKVESPARELGLLSGLVERLERESFAAPFLTELRSRLDADGAPASGRIAELRRRIEWLDWRANQLFAPIAIVLLWDLQMALVLEAWRQRSGPQIATWLRAVARLEAIASLAGYAAEHPADVFPEIVEGGPLLQAGGLGHPLLREDRTVRNDVVIDAEHRVMVVSGSNMSGKSTLLRTVGANVVLALAGATVRAESLTLTPLVVGASIHVHDSLLDGESRFYAEVSRIGRIVSLASDGSAPLLFLLDELFHGTNSHDRRIGAAAVVRALLADGAVGLVTTHDLELARIAEDLDANVVNVHFEDQFEDGRMSFDYRMRPGVVNRSNALALMRAVGLDV